MKLFKLKMQECKNYINENFNIIRLSKINYKVIYNDINVIMTSKINFFSLSKNDINYFLKIIMLDIPKINNNINYKILFYFLYFPLLILYIIIFYNIDNNLLCNYMKLIPKKDRDKFYNYYLDSYNNYYMKINYFNEININKDFTLNEIKNYYNKLTFTNHLDNNYKYISTYKKLIQKILKSFNNFDIDYHIILNNVIYPENINLIKSAYK